MFKSRKANIIYGIICVIILILLDQFTKYLAVQYLMNKPDYIIINNVFQLHYLENTGAAFSMLTGKMTFFLVFTPIVLFFMIYIYTRIPLTKKYNVLSLIIIFVFAGAIGNYIDRFRLNYVVDFLYFSLIDFPVFNVADIYVTCSVALLFFLILFYYKDDDIEVLSKIIKPGKKHE